MYQSSDHQNLLVLDLQSNYLSNCFIISLIYIYEEVSQQIKVIYNVFQPSFYRRCK